MHEQYTTNEQHPVREKHTMHEEHAMHEGGDARTRVDQGTSEQGNSVWTRARGRAWRACRGGSAARTLGGGCGCSAPATRARGSA